MEYPSLVGGSPMRKFELAPSILFAALYGLLIPLFIYRLCCKRSRTSLISGTIGLLVDKTIMFSLRAVVAPDPASEFEQSLGLMEYMQTTLAFAFLGLIVDLAGLLRCVLVNSTYPDDKNELESKSNSSELITEYKTSWMGTYDSEASLSREKTFTISHIESLAGQRPDQPRRRFWFRRMNDVIVALYAVALATGIAGNVLLIVQRDNAKKTRVNQALRCVSSAIALLLALSICGVAAWARQRNHRVNKPAVSYIALLSPLLAIIAVYRLVVMQSTTLAYEYPGPGSYNSVGAKAVFYTLHILPEWTVSVILGVLNVRQTFNTGPNGDDKWWDETPKEKEKREKKEEKKREKKEKKKREKELLKTAGHGTRRWRYLFRCRFF